MTSEHEEDPILPGGLLDANDPAVRAHLHGDLSALRAGRLAGPQLHAALHDFGEAGFLTARPDIEKCLTHADPLARYDALIALVLDWGLQEHRGAAETFLVHDSDHHNRALGATCIGVLAAGTQDTAALRVLCGAGQNEAEERLVRVGAYEALLKVMGIP